MEGKIAAQHDETSLQQLEFPHIIEQIRQHLSTPYGEEQLSGLLPLNKVEEIRKRLQEVDEMAALLEARHYIPLNGLVNILPHLDKVKPENAFLNPDALLEIKNTLKMFSEISRCFKEHRENCPALYFYARGIHSHSQIVRAIESKIEDNGEIPDNASPELRKIRIKLNKIAAEKKKILQQAIKRYSEFSQEEIVTLRDGRMVMGIKQNFVNKVNGIVHGTSGSGATVFVEPMEALQVGNQIQNLKIEERTEIIKILRYITGLVREVRHDLFYGIENIAVLDLIHAKAKLSVELQANLPHISEKPVIKLIEARHPLLILKTGHKNVVPLSLELGNNFTTLVITGPNAGGKTVAMKTVGLLILMVQIGMPIPAHPDSEIPLLSGVLVDIGDRQSLEHDLSTFSAHIIRLSEILKKANSESLVLLDEIGTGTDPREGSALAVAILNRLLMMKVLTIATTHHGDLKAFAHSTPGAENASMQFNLKNLQPTYHLS
ncbi:MAG: endonuclease MutS2, partial [Calditrichia bacterium]